MKRKVEASLQRSSVFEQIQGSIEKSRALILNSSYQPVKLVSWQKALVLWFQGKVEILEYQKLSARTAHAAFQLPSVMRLKKYVHATKISSPEIFPGEYLSARQIYLSVLR